MIQPIIVRPIPGEDAFRIIAGERRFRAACEAFDNDFDMPVVIKDVNDEEAEALALTEDAVRSNMSVVEEAVAAERLVLRNQGDKDEAARALGWTPRSRELASKNRQLPSTTEPPIGSRDSSNDQRHADRVVVSTKEASNRRE